MLLLMLLLLSLSVPLIVVSHTHTLQHFLFLVFCAVVENDFVQLLIIFLQLFSVLL